jgi:hypothetical protein
MNSISRSIAGAVMGLGLLGSVHAATTGSTMDSGSLITAINSYTFTLSVTAPSLATFTAYVSPTVGSQYAPLAFDLFKGASLAPEATIGLGTLGAPGSRVLAVTSLVAGAEYTLVFDSAYTSGAYAITTSLADTQYADGAGLPVPEAGALAMALAGVCVLGLLGRRVS